MVPRKMTVRFVPPNKTARDQSDPISEETWENHKPYILRYYHSSGRNIGVVQKWIADQNIASFKPTYTQLQPRLKSWNAAPEHSEILGRVQNSSSPHLSNKAAGASADGALTHEFDREDCSTRLAEAHRSSDALLGAGTPISQNVLKEDLRLIEQHKKLLMDIDTMTFDLYLDSCLGLDTFHNEDPSLSADYLRHIWCMTERGNLTDSDGVEDVLVRRSIFLTGVLQNIGIILGREQIVQLATGHCPIQAVDMGILRSIEMAAEFFLASARLHDEAHFIQDVFALHFTLLALYDNVTTCSSWRLRLLTICIATAHGCDGYEMVCILLLRELTRPRIDGAIQQTRATNLRTKLLHSLVDHVLDISGKANQNSLNTAKLRMLARVVFDLPKHTLLSEQMNHKQPGAYRPNLYYRCRGCTLCFSQGLDRPPCPNLVEEDLTRVDTAPAQVLDHNELRKSLRDCLHWCSDASHFRLPGHISFAKTAGAMDNDSSADYIGIFWRLWVQWQSHKSLVRDLDLSIGQLAQSLGHTPTQVLFRIVFMVVIHESAAKRQYKATCTVVNTPEEYFLRTFDAIIKGKDTAPLKIFSDKSCYILGSIRGLAINERYTRRAGQAVARAVLRSYEQSAMPMIQPVTDPSTEVIRELDLELNTKADKQANSLSNEQRSHPSTKRRHSALTQVSHDPTIATTDTNSTLRWMRRQHAKSSQMSERRSVGEVTDLAAEDDTNSEPKDEYHTQFLPIEDLVFPERSVFDLIRAERHVALSQDAHDDEEDSSAHFSPFDP